MRRFSALLSVVAALVLSSLNAACAHRVEQSVGFQLASAPDLDDQPLRLAIWYPSDAPSQMTDVGPFQFNVAMDGAASGRAHPLIVISHGTGGSAFNSANLAIRLAEAGFVVAAVTHTGDNYADHANSFSRRNFAERPRQISRVIDFMLREWPSRGAIDPARIGIFGHSAGGAASLIAIGGEFDWSKVNAYCQTNAGDWGCRNAQARRANEAGFDADAAPIIAYDARIRAAVVAAPALAHAFQPDGLANVSVPVQVWVAADDVVVPDAASLQTLLPGRIDYELVANAGHFSFLTPCNATLTATAPEICTDAPGFDRAAFQRRFTREIVEFFEANLPPG